MVFDIVGDLKTERPVKRVNETENVRENQNFFQMNVQETQGNAIKLILLFVQCFN